MKQIIFLSLIILISSCSEYQIDKINPESESYIIMKYVGNSTNLVIPDSIRGKNISEIGNMAFAGKKLENVIIAEGITRIGESAFKDNVLKTIILPNTLTIIEDNAFNNNQLSSIHILDNLEVIGNNAFSNNEILEVVLGINLEVNRNAFDNNPLASLIVNISNSNGRINHNGLVGDAYLYYLSNQKKLGYYILKGEDWYFEGNKLPKYARISYPSRENNLLIKKIDGIDAGNWSGDDGYYFPVGLHDVEIEFKDTKFTDTIASPQANYQLDSNHFTQGSMESNRQNSWLQNSRDITGRPTQISGKPAYEIHVDDRLADANQKPSGLKVGQPMNRQREEDTNNSLAKLAEQAMQEQNKRGIEIDDRTYNEIIKLDFHSKEYRFVKSSTQYAGNDENVLYTWGYILILDR